jgi:predicted metal-binding membrane protein
MSEQPETPKLFAGWSPEILVVALGIIIVTILAWWLNFSGATPMVSMPALPIEYLSLALFTVSWTLGMIAMMFPTAMPMMLMFLHVGRSSSREVRAGGGPTPAKALIFILSYLSFWAGIGVVFYVGLAVALGFLSPQAMALLSSPLGLGISLLVVGVYQVSPLKVQCLNRCHPASFLFKFYRGGISGAVEMGAIYAKYCIGCCWVMMVFLLVIGSMGILWMGAFAGIIFVERVLVSSKWAPRIVGIGFLASGLVFAISSFLA